MSAPITNESVDAVAGFFVFILLGGDVFRTALVLRARTETIATLAASGQWEDKRKEYIATGGAPSEPIPKIRKMLKRFQAGCLQSLLAAILDALEKNQTVENLLESETKSGSTFNPTVLAKLLETSLEVQRITDEVSAGTEKQSDDSKAPDAQEITECFNQTMALADGAGLDAISLVRNVVLPLGKK